MPQPRRPFPWLTAYVVLLGIFLLAPIALVVPVSFNSGPSFNFPPVGFSLRWYDALFHSGVFLRAFLTTLQITVIATTLSIVVGSLASYGLARSRFPGRQACNALLLSPLVFPPIVLGLAMIVFLSSIGLLRTVPGLVLAETVVILPYVVRTVSAALQNLDPAAEEVAAILGANRLRVIWLIVLPSIRAALFSAAVLAGLVAFDEFTIALFVTGGDFVTLPVQIFLSTYFGVDPTVAALGTLLILFSAAIVLVTERVVGLERVFGVTGLAGSDG